MNIQDAVFPIFVFLLSLLTLSAAIPLAKRFGWVDHPSSRRRHLRPMPIVGGISLIAAWIIAGIFYVFLFSTFPRSEISSLGWIASGALALSLMGLVDDLRGLDPRVKLFVEFLVAGTVILAVPEIRDFCKGWESRIGFAGWPLAAIWIVGVSNAMNLVDGLDGLAGGIGFLILLSIGILSFLQGTSGHLALFLSVSLLPALASFLVKNWSPAKVFLGDNGSLPIGFIIGVASLSGTANSNSFSEAFGLIVMLGYPILDMGLCTFRRLKNRNPIFKADRGHLHHRLLRMHIPVSRVVVLILALTVYFQLSAYLLILIARSESFRAGFTLPTSLAILLAIVGAGAAAPIYLLQVLERSKASDLALSIPFVGRRGSPVLGFKDCLFVKVNLAPLFQAGLSEERARISEVIRSLELVVESALGAEDSYFIKNLDLHVFFEGKAASESKRDLTLRGFREKMEGFQKLFGLQYSSSGLRIDWQMQEVFVDVGLTETQSLIELSRSESMASDLVTSVS